MPENIIEGEQKIKIMLVDDDDFLVDMYSAKFANSGVGIVPISSGAILLDKLKKGEVADLILLDIVLPQMNGVEILEQMRRENLGEGIPVVMLTNQNDEGDIEKTKKLNISGYIVKASATPSEVVSTVLSILKKDK